MQIRKLTYLQMIGYDVSWASFSIIEVMSQPRFAHKRIGYLAANQIFNETTDVVLLTVNLFKKEFSNAATSSPFEVGMAINSLANIATPDVARDCISDLVQLMNHPSTYLRKKAVLCMYKLYVKYPQGLRLTFEKFKERLEDPEVSVVSTAVNVICELANKNPKNYLAMAPKFFGLLTSSSNNWMLIKVVKLMGSLVSEEPRLARKLLEPLVTIIQNTGAKSLQYECIFTVCLSLPHTKREDGSDAKNVPSVVKVCSDHLRGFIEHDDQNLKYLGLVGLSELLKSHPKAVVDQRDLILRCLNDEDITIRIRALELLSGIATRKSLPDLCHHLIQHAKRSEGQYRDEIITTILNMCSREKFAMINDFAWYISILLELTSMPGNLRGQQIANQLIEIALRVDTVRAFAVETMLTLLFNEKLVLGQARKTVQEVLKAAAWIVGEYSEIVTYIVNDEKMVYEGEEEDDEEDEEEGYWIEGPNGEEVMSQWRGQDLFVMTIDALLHPRNLALPPNVQSTYLQSSMKVFLRSCADCPDEQLLEIFGLMRTRLSIYLLNPHLEVQERASSIRNLLHELGILSSSWVEELNAAHAAAADSANTGADSLLDISASPIGGVSGRSLDEKAVSMIHVKKNILAAVVAEPFFAVHPKAQKKVPLPEDIDLAVEINPSALEAIMEMEGPENPSVQNVSFVAPINSSTSSESYAPQRDPFEEARLNMILQNSFQKGYQDEEADDQDEMPEGFDSIGGDAQLFYIGKNTSDHAPDISTLSKILGDYEEESRPRRKKDKGKKKKSKKTSIDEREMVPAGMDESDEEEATKSSRKGRGRYKKPTAEEEDTDLNNIDLTTPLGQDEVIPIRKHREVVSLGIEEPLKKDKKREKKEKKDKKDRKDKEKSDSPGRPKKGSKSKGVDSTTASLNLLDLDFGSSSAPVDASSAVMDDVAVPDKSGKAKKEKKEKKDKNGVWLQLYTGRQINIFYSLGDSGMKRVSFRVANRGPSNLTVSADVHFKSTAPFTALTGSGLRLAHHLASGDEARAFMDFDGPELLTGNVHLTASLRIMLEGNAGVETVNATAALKIPVCSTFSPYVLDDDTFSSSISKSSSRWGSSSARVVSTLKAKYSMRAVSNFLRAHTIEVEASKAASMAAKSASGAKVYCLSKAAKDGSSVACDIKVLGSSKSESQSLADAIGSALNELSL